MLTQKEFNQITTFVKLMDGALEEHTGRNITSSEIIMILRTFTEDLKPEVIQNV